jgi:hypothetical protein
MTCFCAFSVDTGSCSFFRFLPHCFPDCVIFLCRDDGFVLTALFLMVCTAWVWVSYWLGSDLAGFFTLSFFLYGLRFFLCFCFSDLIFSLFFCDSKFVYMVFGGFEGYHSRSVKLQGTGPGRRPGQRWDMVNCGCFCVRDSR